ncbi:FadR/GntR family transcriptional regulator [Nocardioides sp. AX2bis]|uniref:FadR/GntR family transcriptional regulator n=1 Tax=Nocardioides sp. AX2bis TaxID=2653157 RepID=UPI0012F07B1B|nr:FCD domain-containing protein [Nocardioides sp. AX2bis]VXC09699.1 GntR family transcriptional regulator [Nocardioides sp. AX2bis]
MASLPDRSFPQRVSRARLYEQVAAQITDWIAAQDLAAGDRLPAERELATRLGVSRATLSQALVALEVVGVVAVRHGDGTVVTERGVRGAAAGRAPLDEPAGEIADGIADGITDEITEAIRAHADRLPDVIDARDALETKLAALAAQRRTAEDLAVIDEALAAMAADVEAGGRGVEGDELFHAAVTAAAHSPLLEQMMRTISTLIAETRLESLSQPGRPRVSLAGHGAVAEAIRLGDPEAAAAAMHAHVGTVSDVALLRGDT